MGFLPSSFAFSLDMIRQAAAPSAVPEDVAALIRPSPGMKGVGREAIFSYVLFARGPTSSSTITGVPSGARP